MRRSKRRYPCGYGCGRFTVLEVRVCRACWPKEQERMEQRRREREDEARIIFFEIVP